MGWLFGKKKVVPKVPLPPGRFMEESSLSFPNKVPVEKVIIPEHVKKAAGVKKPMFPEEPSRLKMPVPKPIKAPDFPTKFMPQPMVVRDMEEPLYVKVEVYQKILGELQDIKAELSTLNSLTKDLEKSEFNEEHNFNKLKGEVKVMHDKLLLADKILFKGD